MTRHHRRGAALEARTAAALGGRRVRRSRFEKVSDLEPLALPSGAVIIVECKSRQALPALVTGALAQAREYGTAEMLPVAVLAAKGCAPVVCMTLADFRVAVGLPAKEAVDAS